MTTTVLQQQANTNLTNKAATTAASATATMAWSTEKLRFSCVDNISLKQLWKLIALDTNASANANANTTTTTTAATTNAFNGNNTSNSNNHNANNKPQQQHQQQQHNEALNVEHCEKLAKLFNNRNNNGNSVCNNVTNNNNSKCNRLDFYNMNASHSLLNFLAINALELSAPAAPVLIEQNQQQHHQQQHHQLPACTLSVNTIAATTTTANTTPSTGWMQLSGHPESIKPTNSGIVSKRVTSSSDSEVLAYEQLSTETQACKIVPHYYGVSESNGEHFIELQDLLHGFKDPCVMDIKLGTRTFLESEVNNKALRADLYQKMIAVDATAPTAEEHAAQAITKLRYMLFREEMSSSHTKGFRIEALRLRGRTPVKDLKMVRSSEQIAQTIEQFVGNRRGVHKELIKRLKQMRSIVEKSTFFQRHEIIGSSVFIVYDDTKVNVWLIDFAKSRSLPGDITVTHRAPWTVGNREEGLLKGLDELIFSFEEVYAQHGAGRKCLQI